MREARSGNELEGEPLLRLQSWPVKERAASCSGTVIEKPFLFLPPAVKKGTWAPFLPSSCFQEASFETCRTDPGARRGCPSCKLGKTGRCCTACEGMRCVSRWQWHNSSPITTVECTETHCIYHNLWYEPLKIALHLSILLFSYAWGSHGVSLSMPCAQLSSLSRLSDK